MFLKKKVDFKESRIMVKFLNLLYNLMRIIKYGKFINFVNLFLG